MAHKSKMQPYLTSEDPDVPMVHEPVAVFSAQSTTRRSGRRSPRGVVKDLVAPDYPSEIPSGGHLVAILEEGLPVQELDDLQESLEIPMEKLMDVLGISKSTLHRRRKGDQRLDTQESDRVIRFARLMRRAVEVFESAGTARQWLQSPQFGLGGAIPLRYAHTEVGAREVEDLLGRIDHSVYS